MDTSYTILPTQSSSTNNTSNPAPPSTTIPTAVPPATETSSSTATSTVSDTAQPLLIQSKQQIQVEQLSPLPLSRDIRYLGRINETRCVWASHPIVCILATVLTAICLLLLIIALITPHLLLFHFPSNETISIGTFRVCLKGISSTGESMDECSRIDLDCTASFSIFTAKIFRNCGLFNAIQFFLIVGVFLVSATVVFELVASMNPLYYKHRWRVIATVLGLLSSLFLLIGMCLIIRLRNTEATSFTLVDISYDVSFILICIDWILVLLATMPFLINTVAMLKNPLLPLDSALDFPGADFDILPDQLLTRPSNEAFASNTNNV